MNLFLKFLASIAGVEAVVPLPSSDDPAPGARMLTSRGLDGESEASSAARNWVPDAVEASGRRSFTPSWQLTGLISLPKQGLTGARGETSMKDVSFWQMAAGASELRVRGRTRV